MNKLTKLLFSVISSVAIATSAFAGEFTVSGGVKATYTVLGNTGTTGTHAVGKGLGISNEFSLTASGELDNGWSVSTTMILTEDSSLSSSNVALTMGGLGTVKVGNGTGSVGSNYDNALPTAYEENHDGMKTTTAIDSMGYLMDGNAILYKSPSFDVGGASVSAAFAYTPEAGDLSLIHI